ncbi:tetratricopeptide repeat protein [Shewanella sp. MSW]|uniref:tetratricopeptide repeat protein n=1 Tax=Shewanella sp. MSW TaxID=2569536 RepID=UPI001186E86C|nr:SEL1-like repeat protein [Shewanella sp. MSW]TVP10801.1 hypothetical protein AYI96_11965 [Shewanella sp. MSW]
MKLILIIIAFVAFFIALKKWQRAQAVKSGDPDAMANEGLRLIGRNSVDEGIALLEQAANKDHPAAAQMLYEFYTRPELEMVPNDADKAMHWAAKASSLDNEFAKLHDLMLELNQHPAFGDNIQLLEQNLLPRAEAGDIESQSQLGRVYARNPILDKDGSKAIKWLELAAAKDDPEACFHLGKLLQEPRQGEADMQQARFWLTKGHQLGETASGGHLAEMMLQGQGGPVDKRQAERLLIEQAKDSSYSQLTLGQRYLSGDQLPQDLHKAREWLEKAAADEENSVAATIWAGFLLEHSHDSQDHLRAKAILEPLAQAWDLGAHFQLGKLYQQGLGINRQLPLALMHFEFAAMAEEAEYIAAKETLAARLSQSEKQQAQALKQEYLTLHPIDNLAQARLDLLKGQALLYADEQEYQELQQALHWLEKAAFGGETLAYEELYETCLKLDKRVDAAVWLYLELAEHNQFGFQGNLVLQQQELLQSFTEAETAWYEQRLEEIRAQLPQNNPAAA